MRHLYLVTMLIFFAGLAVAQTSKGQWMLGSTIGLSNAASLDLPGPVPDNHAGVNFQNTSTKTGDVTNRLNNTIISLAPAVGYFLADGAMIGLSVNYSLVSSEGDKSTILAVTPLLRYYFNNTAKVRPFGEIRAGIANVKEPDYEAFDNIWILGGRGGAAIFVNEKVSVDIFLDYSYSVDDSSKGSGLPHTTNSVFGFGAGFSFFL